jgi:hypothetical protein
MMEKPTRFAPEYVEYVLGENFADAQALFLAPLMQVRRSRFEVDADGNASIEFLDAEGEVIQRMAPGR